MSHQSMVRNDVQKVVRVQNFLGVQSVMFDLSLG